MLHVHHVQQNPAHTVNSGVCTHSEEDPALLLGPRADVLLRGLRELALLVVHLGEVDEDGRRLEDALALVGDGGDTSVRVDLEEPGRLDLVVHLADVGVADA